MNEIEEIPSTKTGKSCLEAATKVVDCEQRIRIYKYKQKKPNNQNHENRDRITGHVETHTETGNPSHHRTTSRRLDRHENEAGEESCDPHALTPGGHSPARAGHAPHRREPHGSVE
jgi:hypothetical protein